MAPTDFLMLYQELGLVPGCSIDELKRAYRRSISKLHPDRSSGSDTAKPIHAIERLQQLTQLYGAAIDFHRRYGRLPGAAVARRPVSSRTPRTRAMPQRPHRSSKTIVIATGIAIVSSFLLYRTPDDRSATPEHSMPPDHAQDAATSPPARLSVMQPAGLKLGMRMQEVLGIEGEPVMRSDDQWDYGPSWIAFEKGRVSSWYSSPLRPLRARMLPVPHVAAGQQDQE